MTSSGQGSSRRFQQAQACRGLGRGGSGGPLGRRLCRLWRPRHDASSTIVYEIQPGQRLGWHTDATEETQYVIAGTGKLFMEDGRPAVGPGSVFVLPTP